MIKLLKKCLLQKKSLEFNLGFYEPEKVTCLTKRGRGLLIWSYKKEKYLLRHSEEGEPELVGRAVGRIFRKRDHYLVYLIPYNQLNPNERVLIESQLAKIYT